MSINRILVTGSGGFIGHHLATYVRNEPQICLEEEIARTCGWIEQPVHYSMRVSKAAAGR